MRSGGRAIPHVIGHVGRRPTARAGGTHRPRGLRRTRPTAPAVRTSPSTRSGRRPRAPADAPRRPDRAAPTVDRSYRCQCAPTRDPACDQTCSAPTNSSARRPRRSGRRPRRSGRRPRCSGERTPPTRPRGTTVHALRPASYSSGRAPPTRPGPRDPPSTRSGRRPRALGRPPAPSSPWCWAAELLVTVADDADRNAIPHVIRHVRRRVTRSDDPAT